MNGKMIIAVVGVTEKTWVDDHGMGIPVHVWSPQRVLPSMSHINGHLPCRQEHSCHRAPSITNKELVVALWQISSITS